MNAIKQWESIVSQPTGLIATGPAASQLNKLTYTDLVDMARTSSSQQTAIQTLTQSISQMDELTDDYFRRMFRLSRSAFTALLEKISDDFIMPSVSSSGSAISPKTQLAVALRWLAGGSYIDICFAFGISHVSVLHKTAACTSINISEVWQSDHGN